MFTLPGSEIPEGKQVLVLEELVLPHVPVPINWRMDGPMRVALRGPNGCGKSTLLKVMLGETARVTGICKVSVRCAYLDQHLSRLDLSQSVMTHLSTGNTPLEEGRCVPFSAASTGRRESDTTTGRTEWRRAPEGRAGLRIVA